MVVGLLFTFVVCFFLFLFVYVHSVLISAALSQNWTINNNPCFEKLTGKFALAAGVTSGVCGAASRELDKPAPVLPACLPAANPVSCHSFQLRVASSCSPFASMSVVEPFLSFVSVRQTRVWLGNTEVSEVANNCGVL